jgi:hypothetical protein
VQPDLEVGGDGEREFIVVFGLGAGPVCRIDVPTVDCIGSA